RILEIGCGEGGNLPFFLEANMDVVGVDLNTSQIERARSLLAEDLNENNKLLLLHQNIYDVSPKEIGQFDIIMLRDVIEHIPNQEKFISFLKDFLKKDGIVFFGFPPWYMPFGGHQQGCDSALKKMPYFHILPAFLYSFILKFFGEKDYKIENLLQTKATGISIERFKKIVKQSNWQILDETLYLINPNYEVKFSLKPRKQFKLIAMLPFIRNFFSTCAYYIISPKS
ncbi:MAG: class I SAM-dependent methyltransferase, partial [Bacteroidetes bacterium]|nr:class I SAM-dependent methyltransferase [Bacteroidota bacterium]